MLRERLMARRVPDRPGWRWRGREVTRIEALSDAVFGFAITLLVISLEVPQTFSELLVALEGMVAFAVCFALLFMVWFHQYRFFRRFGLEDGITITLNGVLLFVIVFFVYPLKFVFGFVIGALMGDPSYVVGPAGEHIPKLAGGQAQTMMLVYGLGYLSVFVIFALLHLHAYRKRAELELSELEVFDTVDNVRESVLNITIAALSIVLAYFGGPSGPSLGGLSYWLIGPGLGIHGWMSSRARKRLSDRLEAAGTPAVPATSLYPAAGAVE